MRFSKPLPFFFNGAFPLFCCVRVPDVFLRLHVRGVCIEYFRMNSYYYYSYTLYESMYSYCCSRRDSGGLTAGSPPPVVCSCCCCSAHPLSLSRPTNPPPSSMEPPRIDCLCGCCVATTIYFTYVQTDRLPAAKKLLQLSILVQSSYLHSNLSYTAVDLAIYDQRSSCTIPIPPQKGITYCITYSSSSSSSSTHTKQQAGLKYLLTWANLRTVRKYIQSFFSILCVVVVFAVVEGHT